MWRIPEDELQVLGDVRDRDVLEYGCGAAQWSVALAADGAASSVSTSRRAQLRHARALVAEGGHPVPLVCAGGEEVPFADATFDLVFCDHGAMSFCDPDRSVPEVARVLRPGGRLVFSHSTPWPYLDVEPEARARHPPAAPFVLRHAPLRRR